MRIRSLELPSRRVKEGVVSVWIVVEHFEAVLGLKAIQSPYNPGVRKRAVGLKAGMPAHTSTDQRSLP